MGQQACLDACEVVDISIKGLLSNDGSLRFLNCMRGNILMGCIYSDQRAECCKRVHVGQLGLTAILPETRIYLVVS